jgi:hypothetical protein
MRRNQDSKSNPCGFHAGILYAARPSSMHLGNLPQNNLPSIPLGKHKHLVLKTAALHIQTHSFSLPLILSQTPPQQHNALHSTLTTTPLTLAASCLGGDGTCTSPSNCLNNLSGSVSTGLCSGGSNNRCCDTSGNLRCGSNGTGRSAQSEQDEQG